MNTKVLFSSQKDDWETPMYVFNLLNEEFHFTLDPAASETNHKCNKYFTKEQDGLLQDWGGETVFVNPPYGRNTVGLWVSKAYTESMKPNTTVVMLVPARTDTQWFHEYVLNKAEIRFVRRRLKFGNSVNSAPFPSIIIIYRNGGLNMSNSNYPKNIGVVTEQGYPMGGFGFNPISESDQATINANRGKINKKRDNKDSNVGKSDS